jgi:hypothetical protein
VNSPKLKSTTEPVKTKVGQWYSNVNPANNEASGTLFLPLSINKQEDETIYIKIYFAKLKLYGASMERDTPEVWWDEGWPISKPKFVFSEEFMKSAFGFIFDQQKQ